ncbi:PKD domain-containing protein [Chitinophaga sp. CB10]|uniref:gliding motility-associated C-terminal domain-containing protein n=1 Tax=Chitinophaga sp. CB10 TaxID=1891659 RepID=UPI0025BF7B35|nr:PKD domain-containing protein [Chitinophaga sp. CB10]
MKYPQAKCFRTLLLLIVLLVGGKLYAQQANFTYTTSPASLCAPVTVTLQNTTTGSPVMYTWDFGDGRTSHDLNPQITYTTGGVKRITLTAKYYNTESSYYKEFTVAATPVPDFRADVTQSCKVYTANFTDLTPDGAVRTWTFGDGSAPVTTTSATVAHTYSKAGKFDVTLKVANANGCTQQVTKASYINISLPEVTLSAPVSGCVPYQAALTATSTNTINDPVTGYTWEFGDGVTQNGNASVTHTYTQTGTYPVTLTVNTSSGCVIKKTFDRQVRTGNPPGNVSFTAAPLVACTGEPVRLIANAQYADTYSWDFGDGATQETTSNDIRHSFNANGNLSIQMKAGSNGCYTAATPVAVTINGPVSSFSFVRNCNKKSEFSFTNTSTNTTASSTYQWDFGDNSPVETGRDAVHTYTTPGKYTVRLTVQDNGGACTHSSFQTVYYFNADFTTGVSAICRGSNATYEVLNVPLELVAGYTWNFGDGTTQQTNAQSYTKNWPAAGTYDDQLTIHYNHPAYCDDVVRKTGNISILAPAANFDLSGGACAGQPVSFRNTSVTSPNIPLTNWQWDLGNGLASASQTPPATKYSASGSYNVKLVITDARNCMDSITKAVTINPAPFLKVTATNPKICEGAGTTLTAITDGNVQWLTTDNISCIYCTTPVVSPPASKKYLAEATNAYGCTMRDSLDVTVVPKPNLTVAASDIIVCYGSSTKLQASGAAYYNWTPVDGLTNNKIADPISTPTADITYQVTGANDPMCPASTPVTVKVSVKPTPEVNAGKDQTISVGTATTLMATGSLDVVKWEWSPADYLSHPNSPVTIATVRKPMTYSITGTNRYGCTKTDVMEVNLVCGSDAIFIPNSFSPNGDGVNDVFYPRGKGISFVKSLRVFNRWGQEVYHREKFNTDDISKGWDGYFKGQPQSADVYIYFLEAYCDTNELLQLKGNLTLLR